MDALIVFGAKYLVFVTLAIAAIIFWRLPRMIQKDVSRLAVIVLPLAFILSRLASLFYHNPRPFVVENFVPLVAHAADNGFPSDHALLTSAVAMVLWWAHRRASIGVWILAVVIGVSRVLAGVHHPIDILGSMALAIVAGIAADAILSRALPAGRQV